MLAQYIIIITKLVTSHLIFAKWTKQNMEMFIKELSMLCDWLKMLTVEL